MLPVVGAAPALTKGTIGVEPTGEAERAIIARSEVLAPWAQGVAKCEVKRPWREGKQELEALLQTGRRKGDVLPPEGEHKRTIMPQGSPDKHKHVWLPGEVP